MKNKYKRESRWVTFSCGHTLKHTLGGYSNEYINESFQDVGSTICWDCKQKLKREEFLKTFRKAKLKSEELELVELEGTERQIELGTVIRIENINTFLEHQREFRKFEAMVMRMFDLEKSSAFYIEKLREAGIKTIINIANTYYSTYVNPLDNTIIPNEFKDIIAEIKLVDGTIKVSSPKNNEVIKILKEKYYSWDYPYWFRKIDNFNGPLEDRLVEITNSFLLKGIGVTLKIEHFEDIKEKAIAGNYKHEVLNWILSNEDNLIIRWAGYSPEYYEAARKIKGSKWVDRKVSIPYEKYREVLDFADMYNFKISEKTLERIQPLIDMEKSKIKIIVPKEKKANLSKMIEVLENGPTLIPDLED